MSDIGPGPEVDFDHSKEAFDKGTLPVQTKTKTPNIRNMKWLIISQCFLETEKKVIEPVPNHYFAYGIFNYSKISRQVNPQDAGKSPSVANLHIGRFIELINP